MRKFLLTLSCLSVFLAPGTVIAGCPAHFAGGADPIFTNQAIAAETKEICFLEYAVMHSGLTRTPLWSAEHLTAERVEAARTLKRHDDFHAEPFLAGEARAELTDYTHSGYDRGHMSPSGDFSTPEAQDESFSLANIVPQDSWNNQYLWEGIESAVRTLAVKDGDLYVITGPLFRKGDSTHVKHVLVPALLFKAVYDKRRNEAGVYIAENKKTWDYKVISVSELETLVGINLFPAMPFKVKQVAMALPAPTPHNAKYAGNDNRRNHSTVPHAGWMATKVAKGLMHSYLRY